MRIIASKVYDDINRKLQYQLHELVMESLKLQVDMLKKIKNLPGKIAYGQIKTGRITFK